MSDRDHYYDRRNDPLYRKYLRHQRKKRFLFFVIFSLIVILIIGGIVLLVKSAISNHKESVKLATDYIFEKNQPVLSEVDNVYSDEERSIYFPDEKNESYSELIGEIAKATPNPEYVPKYSRSGLIIVDAGHGGTDSGAFNGDVYEKEVNLDIAFWVKEELELRGYTVFMMRSDDSFIKVEKRAEIANTQTKALAMVSIHQNSIEEDEPVKGVEAWTYDRAGCKELGECLVKNVCAATGAKDRGVSFKKNLVVTSRTTMPSVILECGYLSTDEEMLMLIDQDYQVKIARGVANAIDEFIDLYY